MLHLLNPSKGSQKHPRGKLLYQSISFRDSSNQGEDFARKAVRSERRLELGMEGHRFFDLVRWGIAAEEKNKYFEREKIKKELI